MRSPRARMALARIAAAGLLTAAMTAMASSAGAQNASAAVPADATFIKISAAADAGPQKVSLPVNKGAVIEFDRDVRDVFAASPGIVDAVVRTPRRIFVMAQKIGSTNLILLDAQGGRIGTVEITVG